MNTPDITPSYAPLIMLFFSFALIAVGYIVYKKKLKHSSDIERLKIIDRMSIDRKNGIVLIKAVNNLILLGTSPAGIVSLAQIEEQKSKSSMEKIIEFPKILDNIRA